MDCCEKGHCGCDNWYHLGYGNRDTQHITDAEGMEHAPAGSADWKGDPVGEWYGPQDGLPPVGTSVMLHGEPGNTVSGCLEGCVVGHHWDRAVVYIAEMDDYVGRISRHLAPQKSRSDLVVDNALRVLRDECPDIDPADPVLERALHELHDCGLLIGNDELQELLLKEPDQ